MTPSRKRVYREHELSRRERQIMQAIYRTGQATVADILTVIPDPPTADSIRRMCHILEDKGFLTAKTVGNSRVYRPTVTQGRAARSALTDVVDNFFDGSPRMLVAALLDTHKDRLSPEDVARLRGLIDTAEDDEPNEAD